MSKVLRRSSQSAEGESVLAVYEIPEFRERLLHMREVFDQFRSNGGKFEFDKNRLNDPWVNHSFIEVQEIVTHTKHDAHGKAIADVTALVLLHQLLCLSQTAIAQE